ncbi:hypothetical protein DUNSADRAFT_14295 [Dunaliella salina]|uniref:peptidylprolyl isomerase n=1 Tax=Dunaliella salina TaxID=3046 RepID=A0ABQ7H2R6_DUNSA|nr:hypothetical protein DUNSADRAFT_14295 [Dunaliella salina]|eukprot:KAF5841120.1 hypothetical protein DUNSADRAFT_14295 [Dunaliella salina]
MQLCRPTTLSSSVYGRDAHLPPAAARPKQVSLSAQHSTGHANQDPVSSPPDVRHASRRDILSLFGGAPSAAILSGILPGTAKAGQLSPLDKNYKMEMARRRRKIPIEEFSDGPEGLKYYDVVAGDGDEPVRGDRVAVHYDVKFRSITIATSRAGAGVTGGTPVGFNVGTPADAPGGILPGIDLGVLGMHVGGLRRLIVPPELAYGDKQMGEITPNSTLQIDLELLSIQPKNPFGSRVKLVEG